MAVRVLSDRSRASVLICDLLDVSEEDWQATPEPVRRGIQRVLEELARLREQAGQTSRNSSRPPSSDSPSVPARKQEPTGRAPGGQPGHPGQSRALVPAEQVDAIVVVRPPRCDWCGQALGEAKPDPDPGRHQVHELPQVRATVTEYQLHTLTCPQCQERTVATLPPGVPEGLLGPRALATVAACTGQYHLSKRATAALLDDLCGLQVSEATICAAEQSLSAALAAPVAEAREAVQAAPDKGIDETGWSQQRDLDPGCSTGEEGEPAREHTPEAAPASSVAGASGALPKAWLWVAVSAAATVFLIRRSRGSQVVRELLGAKPKGFIGSDRWSAYACVVARFRQLCWAHLRRDFLQISEREGVSASLGFALLAHTERLFDRWHRYQDGTLSWRAFRTQMIPIREAVGALLREGAALAATGPEGPAQKTARTCQNILKWETSLWTFVRHQGLPPTNNRAEQAVRAAVLYRKISFGTQCREGSRYIERVLTAVATCKQHRRNVLDYLTDAAAAYLRGEPAPSLLPVPVRA